MPQYQLITGAGATIVLDDVAVTQLAASLRGSLIRPGDADYDTARAVWNGMIDRHPALIARCVCTEDVVTAISFARAHELLVAVRGGGHNVAGSAVCDNGLVIDLSRMKAIQIDPAARTVRAQAGLTWGDLDRATQELGLATPGGLVSETGIAGLTLGGGIGWLRNKYGLSCDNLISAEIVTADGQVRTVSAHQHADLFWALRGGGGNYGVVTMFEYQLHPVGPEVALCFVLYPATQAREALQFFRSYAAAAPDEISTIAVMGTVPHADAYPLETHGQRYIVFGACDAGPVDVGQQVLQPLREWSTPMLDFSGVMPYVDVQTLWDADYPAGKLRYYWKSIYVDELSDAVIDRLVEAANASPSHHATVDVWHMGGAIGRIDATASAFGRRDMPYLIGIEGNWEDARDDESNIAWTRTLWADLHRFSSGAVYLNFPGFGEEGDALVRAGYGENYDRLAALKRTYDPTNLFRLNQNVAPAT